MLASHPRQIGRFRIHDVNGRGAFTVDYLGHDPETDETVTIRMVETDALPEEARDSFGRLFVEEALAARGCTHPGLAAVHDAGIHEGQPYIVAAHVEGMSLRRMIDRGVRFSPAEAAFVMLQTLDALSAVHAQGLVHGNVQPSSILLLLGGQAKLTDLGLLRPDRVDPVAFGDMVDSPGYLSPEQCEGEEPEPASDLFSAAVTLQEMMTGIAPFGRGPLSRVQSAIMLLEAPRLPEGITARAPGLQDVLDRALAKHREDRFASAAQMAGALRACVVPSATRRPARPQMAEAQAPAPAPPAARHDPGFLQAVEHAFSRRVGPVASVLIRQAAPAAASREALLRALAQHIPDAQERHDFLIDARHAAEGRPVQARPKSATAAPVFQRPAPEPLPPEEVERAGRALGPHLGPVARILARRVAVEAVSIEDLWRKLARHIEAEGERSTFLAKRRD